MFYGHMTSFQSFLTKHNKLNIAKWKSISDDSGY